MLAYSLYAFFGGYALFLLGFAIFMYFENQKFGDNQFTMKLLPPPSKREGEALETVLHQAVLPSSDWTAMPAAAATGEFPSVSSEGKILASTRR